MSIFVLTYICKNIKRNIKLNYFQQLPKLYQKRIYPSLLQAFPYLQCSLLYLTNLLCSFGLVFFLATLHLLTKQKLQHYATATFYYLLKFLITFYFIYSYSQPFLTSLFQTRSITALQLFCHPFVTLKLQRHPLPTLLASCIPSGVSPDYSCRTYPPQKGAVFCT